LLLDKGRIDLQAQRLIPYETVSYHRSRRIISLTPLIISTLEVQ